jgi:exopolysaccharide biosynthesis polyprenyl glycosylphosphotransferase
MNAGRWSLLRWSLDLGLLTAAFSLANWAKWNLPFGQAPDPGTRFVTPLTIALLLTAWSFFGRVTALYHPRQAATLAQELQRAAITLALTLITLAGLFLMLRYYFFSRLLLVYLLGSSFLFMVAFRLALWRAWRSWGAHGMRRVLIVGGGPSTRRIIQALRENLWDRGQVVGILADSPSDIDLALLGPPQAVGQIVREYQVDEVIITQQERSSVLQVVQALRTTPVRIKVVPSYLELASVTATITLVGDIPLLELRAPAIDDWDAVLKRALDLTVFSLALLVLWPVMLVLALLIKLTSPGPALFRQERVGENGHVFTLFKFRTMTVDAPPLPPMPAHTEQLGQSHIKTARDDPHITPLGHLLRRFALDELPQLLNVFKGEMSMVGPRPEVPPVVEMYNPWHLKRLAIKPGMTGPVQLSGSADLPLDERVKLELVYIQNYALWEDLKILAKTLAAVVRGKGVY